MHREIMRKIRLATHRSIAVIFIWQLRSAFPHSRTPHTNSRVLAAIRGNIGIFRTKSQTGVLTMANTKRAEMGSHRATWIHLSSLLNPEGSKNKVAKNARTETAGILRA